MTNRIYSIALPYIMPAAEITVPSMSRCGGRGAGQEADEESVY